MALPDISWLDQARTQQEMRDSFFGPILGDLAQSGRVINAGVVAEATTYATSSTSAVAMSPALVFVPQRADTIIACSFSCRAQIYGANESYFFYPELRAFNGAAYSVVQASGTLGSRTVHNLNLTLAIHAEITAAQREVSSCQVAFYAYVFDADKTLVANLHRALFLEMLP